MDSITLSYISILISIASLFVAILSCVISNKPYLKKISISLAYPEKKGYVSFAITNIGREPIYIEHIEIIKIRTRKTIGYKFYMIEEDFICALAPGEVHYSDIEIIDEYENPLHTTTPNKTYKVVIHEKNGHKTVFKNIFPEC